MFPYTEEDREWLEERAEGTDWDTSPGEAVLGMIRTSNIEDAESALLEWAAAFKAGSLKLRADGHLGATKVFEHMTELVYTAAQALHPVVAGKELAELDRLGRDCSEEVDTVFNALADELEDQIRLKTVDSTAKIVVDALRHIDDLWMKLCGFCWWDELVAETEHINHTDARDLCAKLLVGAGSVDDPIEVE